MKPTLDEKDARIAELHQQLIEEREHGAKVWEANKEKARRIRELEAALAKFKVWGTDGCRGQNDTCQGRITLFVTSERCMTCERQALKGED